MKKYCEISYELIKFLPKRTKDIIVQRFGLFGEERSTLEEVGMGYKVTRERIRQIEKDGMKQIKKKVKAFASDFDYLKERLNHFGGVKREDLFVRDVMSEGSDDEKNCIRFLFHLCEGFSRFPKNQYVFAFWARDVKTGQKAKETLEEIANLLIIKNKPLKLDEIKSEISREDVGDEFLFSIIETSKRVAVGENGLYGLSRWPEINPRGIKDRAYLLFKKVKKPLHFRELAALLGNNTNPQTTHNELIKDPRFVLVGRGVYALAEWGYIPGQIKEIIKKLLSEKGALKREEIIVYVSEQRIVKENTIVQNLSNKDYFIRTPDGKYTIA